METTQARVDGRTHYEAVLDVSYGVRFNELCERFYCRIDMAFGFVSLAGGSAAFAAVMSNSQTLVAVAGCVLAVVSILERLVGASKKAEQHAAARKCYGELHAEADALDLGAIDRRLRLLQSSLPGGIKLLAKPAHNANLQSSGCVDRVLPLSRSERLAEVLV